MIGKNPMMSMLASRKESLSNSDNTTTDRPGGPRGYVPPPPAPKVVEGQFVVIEPGDNDVLCGRGSRVNNHPGNVQFRQLVAQFKDLYLDPNRRKIEKAHICAYVVSLVRELKGGKFLKENVRQKTWIEVGDVKARKKAGQALREDASEIRSEQPPPPPPQPCTKSDEELLEDMLLRASVESFRLSCEDGNFCVEIDFAQFLKECDRDMLHPPCAPQVQTCTATPMQVSCPIQKQRLPLNDDRQLHLRDSMGNLSAQMSFVSISTDAEHYNKYA